MLNPTHLKGHADVGSYICDTQVAVYEFTSGNCVMRLEGGHAAAVGAVHFVSGDP